VITSCSTPWIDTSSRKENKIVDNSLDTFQTELPVITNVNIFVWYFSSDVSCLIRNCNSELRISMVSS